MSYWLRVSNRATLIIHALGLGNPLLRRYLPSHCPLCFMPAKGGQFCLPCQQDLLQAQPLHRCVHCSLPLPTHAPCPQCWQQRPLLRHVYCLFDYAPPLDALIWRFKSLGETTLAYAFTQWAIQHHPHWRWPSQTIVIPIPSHPHAFARRGYNPAAVFARQLAKSLQCRYDDRALRYRPFDHIAQKSLNRQARRWHAAQRYQCTRSLDGAHCLLVDDVFTTGGTLNGASRCLRSAGAHCVDAIVIARTPWTDTCFTSF